MHRDQNKSESTPKIHHQTPRALLLHLSRLLRPYPAAQALIRKATAAN